MFFIQNGKNRHPTTVSNTRFFVSIPIGQNVSNARHFVSVPIGRHTTDLYQIKRALGYCFVESLSVSWFEVYEDSGYEQSKRISRASPKINRSTKLILQIFSIIGPLQCGLYALSSVMRANGVKLNVSVQLGREDKHLAGNEAYLQRKLEIAQDPQLPGHGLYEITEGMIMEISTQRKKEKYVDYKA